MNKFNPHKFILDLQSALFGVVVFERLSSEPLKYKINGSTSFDYAFITFEVVKGEVEVAVTFGPDIDTKFLDIVQSAILDQLQE